MDEVNVNCCLLEQYLSFLIRQNLVEEQTLHDKRQRTRLVYTITERGQTTLKWFRKLNSTLQQINARAPL